MDKRHSTIPHKRAMQVLTAFAALSMSAGAITWEGATNLAMTAATTVDVPAGRTNRIDKLSGAYTLTKTGGGVLEIRWVASSGASISIAEGTVRFTNPRPDAIFGKAAFHVDASDASSMTIVTENGTNFVTRWNDTDGRATPYATPSADTAYGRVPGRLPFIGQGTQNGLPYVDFGSFHSRGYTNEEGVAIGYGAALIWNSDVAYQDGFTVASDTPDIATLPVTWPGSTAWYAMSFFSRHDGVSGYRGQFYTSHLPYIYKDNGQNNAVTEKGGGSNWVDGVYIANPRSSYGYPQGFHVMNCSTPTGGRANAFGKAFNSNTYTSFGGTRIAEYALFEERLSPAERAEMTGYLRAKWFPLAFVSVSVEEGASLAIDDDVALQATISENGARDLSIGSQSIVLDKGLSSVGALLHLDASRADTMVLDEVNGTNFVTRWNDVDGGAEYVIPDDVVGVLGTRTNPGDRKPYVSPDMTLNGLPTIDFGTVLFSTQTNAEGVAYGYGGAFRVAGRPNLVVREYLSVIADREDLKTAPKGLAGPSHLAYHTGNSWSGQNAGRRGETVVGKNPPIFLNVSGSANKVCVNGTNYIDGVKRAYNYNIPDGFAVVNIRPAGVVSCNLIARTLRSVGNHDTYGGQRLAEYMIFSSVLGDARRQRIYNALRNKWFGDLPATTNFYGSLSLGEKAFLAVRYEAVAVTNGLCLAGTLEAPAVSAANVAATGANATLDGALTLTDGATLSFSRLADGSWTSLSATSVAAEGAVTVSLSCADGRGLAGTAVRLVTTENPPASLDGWSISIDSSRAMARLVLKDDGIWAEFFTVGTVLFVR